MKFDPSILQAIRSKMISVDPTTGDITNAEGRLLRGEWKNGYRVLVFSLAGQRVRARWHRVVWLAVHGEIPTGFSVCHRDNDKTNNAIENLYLATHAENIADASKTGRMYGKCSDAVVARIHALTGMGYSIDRICRETDISRPTVLRALSR